MRSAHLGIFSIAVMTAILFMAPTFSSAYADVGDDNPGKAKGCDNANEKSKVKEKNPHCEVKNGPTCDLNDDTADCDGDGIQNADDECPSTTEVSEEDHDGDGEPDTTDNDKCDPNIQ